MRLRLALWLTAACWALTTVPVADAQTPGVHPEPDSPAGTEYQVPLEQAREDARPPGRQRSSSGRDAVEGLFGAGVETRGRGGVSSGTSSDSARDRSPRGGSKDPGSSTERRREERGRLADTSVTKALTSTASTQGLTATVIALALVVLAAGAGFLTRRKLRSGG